MDNEKNHNIGNASHSSLCESVLNAVEKGRVAMRPRWHFILHAAIAVLGAIILLLCILYLASFIIFVMRQTGAWFVPIFGSRGWYALFMSLPWLLVLAAVVCVFVLEVVLKRYAFAYKRPLLYSALGVVFLATLGGLAVARTPLHARLSVYAEKNQLPFAGPLYNRLCCGPIPNIYRGMITDIGGGGLRGSGFEIQNKRGERIFVVVASSTRMPLGDGFSSGDVVVVFGDRFEDAIQAFGIRKLQNGD